MPRETLTDRLVLTPIDAAEPETVSALFTIQSDPATWRHLPDGVETDVSQSRTMAEDQARSWRDQGLGGRNAARDRCRTLLQADHVGLCGFNILFRYRAFELLQTLYAPAGEVQAGVEFGTLRLLVGADNAPAIHLYEETGFIAVGETDAYDEHWLQMERLLTA